jgi:hypothetical protein
MMSDTTVSEIASSYEFRMATVFRHTFLVCRRGFLLFLLLGVLCAGGRFLANPLYAALSRTIYTYAAFHRTTFGWLLDGYWSSFTVTLIYAFLSSLLLKATVGFAVFWTDDILAGNRPNVVHGLRNGLANIPVVVIGAVLTSFATYAGMIFLVIPGLVIGSLFAAAAPAASFEKTGIAASIKRSIVLTKGNIWHIFAIGLLPYAVYYAYVQIVNYAMLRSMGVANYASSYLYYVFPANALYNSFVIALACVIYFELRASKEGVRTQTIAGVFD